MYWEYFGFEENPFSISPDPRYLYMSKRHQEALAHLVYGIGEAGGFVLLTGEVGTGKTTICRSLIEQLPDTVDLAFVLNPRVNEIELLATICDEMGVTYPRVDPSLKILVDRLNEHLLRAHAIGRQPVLLIDEAQNLDPKVLEQIRLLTNLETNKRKLLQIVLIGQPELNEILAREDLRQLDQRITARYHLRPLTLDETGGYIRHRLQVGGAPIDIFSDRAIRAIFRATGGIPRLINTLCDRCLLGAYAENRRKVDAKLVRGAAKEVLSRRRARSQTSFALPGVLATVVAAAAFLLLDPLDLGTPGSLFSVQETELTPEAMDEPPAPVAAPSETAIAANNPVETSTAPDLDHGDVAAAEVREDPGADAPTEAEHVSPTPATATTDATANGDAALLPPPPPPPMPTDTARVDQGASAATETLSAAGQTDTAPIEVAAAASATTATGTDAGDAGSQSEPPPGVTAAAPGTEYEAGTWSAIAQPSPDAIEVGDTPVELAALTPTTDVAGPTSPAAPKRSLEEALKAAGDASDLESALNTLFAAWNYDYREMKGLSPCKKARYASLRCLQGQGSWHELRIANRPAVITLSVDAAKSDYGVLVGLNGEQAQIKLGDGTTVSVTIGTLSRLWTGDYLLLWRPPNEFSRELRFGVRGEDVQWLRGKLSSLGWDTSGAADPLSFDDGLQEAVRRFQRRQGLAVDGIAGPRTILQVNAALGETDAPTIQ